MDIDKARRMLASLADSKQTLIRDIRRATGHDTDPGRKAQAEKMIAATRIDILILEDILKELR